MAPTSAPRTTRGSRTCQTMVTSTPGTEMAGCQGSRVSSASPTTGSDRSAGPTATPMATAATKAAVATAIAGADRTRGIAVRAGAVPVAVAGPGWPVAGPGWPVAGLGGPVAGSGWPVAACAGPAAGPA